jgi:hypothetical protein
MWEARLTADHEAARRFELGVGDDVVVDLMLKGRRVGQVTTAAYGVLRESHPELPTLRDLLDAERSRAVGPLHFHTLGGR